MDGILGIELIDKCTQRSYIIFSCYLPPSNSEFGRDGSSFFTHLLTELYRHCEADNIVLCGDFNARIGEFKDYIVDIDGICELF